MPTITLPDGTQAEATPVDFEATDDTWNEYDLADGSTLKVKLNLNGVYRVEDHYNDMGEPTYIIQSGNQVRVLDIPEDLLQADVEVTADPTNDNGNGDRSFQ